LYCTKNGVPWIISLSSSPTPLASLICIWLFCHGMDVKASPSGKVSPCALVSPLFFIRCVSHNARAPPFVLLPFAFSMLWRHPAFCFLKWTSIPLLRPPPALGSFYRTSLFAFFPFRVLRGQFFSPGVLFYVPYARHGQVSIPVFSSAACRFEAVHLLPDAVV